MNYIPIKVEHNACKQPDGRVCAHYAELGSPERASATARCRGAGACHNTIFVAVATEPAVRAEAHARTTDPDTSHEAARVQVPTKLREQIMLALVDSTRSLYRSHGLTGHQMAEATRRKLNSVTPRLAELRRAGLIKDSGRRDDGQIVWVLA